MVYLHITYKNCFPTLSGKKGTVLKLSLTVFNNLKVLLLLDFIKCTTCRREKTPSFFDDSNENSRSFQATYVATSEPKTVSLLKENQDDL